MQTTYKSHWSIRHQRHLMGSMKERPMVALFSFLFLLHSLFSEAQSGLLWSSLAANLTYCHPSFSEAHRPTNCCPPIKDSDQPLLDFDRTWFVHARTRVRRPVHLLDPAYIAKYKKAVALMKSLPSDHPHSFIRQAGNHCLYCTGSYDQTNSSSLFRVHRSWLFFPWHRAFLLFHERILGKLIGDETFALPYWSWDTPEGMQIPKIFNGGILGDEKRDKPHLPPAITELNYEVEKGDAGRQPDEQIEENLALMYRQMVSGARKKELFLGCKLTAGEEGFCDGPGTIELAPHNTLHAWLGSKDYPEGEDMGAFYAAALDPLFYGHHANIDRMWDLWREIQESSDNGNFQDPAWLDTAFSFYDENLRFVRIRVRDLLDTRELGYEYERIPLPWLNARPKPKIKTVRKRGQGRPLRREAEERERRLASTVSVEVYRPRRGRSREEKEREEEIIVVEGIVVDRDVYAKFDVFVNLEGDVDRAGPLDAEFAGTFVNVPRGAKMVGEERKEGKGTTLKLGITEVLEGIGAEEDESVWVSLVPRGGSGQFIRVGVVRIGFLS